MANWGKRIKEARELKNMTQAELAEQVGTNVRTVRRWETEESIPDVLSGLKLAFVLDIPFGKLFGDEN